MRARPEPTQLEHLSDAPFLGKLQVCPANVRLDCKVIATYNLFALVDSEEGKQFYNIDTRNNQPRGHGLKVKGHIHKKNFVITYELAR